jgi:hypothetical protein
VAERYTALQTATLNIHFRSINVQFHFQNKFVMLPLLEKCVPFVLALVVYYISFDGVFYFVISKSVMLSNSILEPQM